MQELDLDELDQAVNKLMSNGGKAKPKADDSAQTTPSDDSGSDADDNTVKVKTTPKPSSDDNDDAVPVSVRRQTLDIPTRNRGIAMDIVQSKPVAAPPKVARTAPTLQPTTDKVEPEPPSPRATEPDPKAPEVSDDTLASLDMQADGTAMPDGTTDEPSHKSDFPDPLDVHGFHEEDAKDADDESADEPQKDEPDLHHEATNVEPSAEAEAEIKEEQTEEKQAEAESDDEPSSPFVNTKVDKRPLGAFADKPVAEDEKADDDEPDDDGKIMEHSDTAKLETQAKDGASVPVQETPKELSPELVAVESSEAEFTPTNIAAADKDSGGDMNQLRQMSIPQQYQADEKVPSETDRPVFDTKEYHPPLNPDATATHKSSKAGLIVTIILILLMIGAAALAYMTITGGLDLTHLL